MAEYQGAYIVDPELQDLMVMELSDQSGTMAKVARLMGVPQATAENWRYKERVRCVPLAAVKWAISLTMAPALIEYWTPVDTRIVECKVQAPPSMDREKEFAEVTAAAAQLHQGVIALTSGKRPLSPQQKRDGAAFFSKLRRELDEAEALFYRL